MEEYYKISKSKLRRLLKKEEKLDALENLGVDNWQGYDMQWDEDMIGFTRMREAEEFDKYIEENYEPV